ncbi:tyrosine-protein kinase receptor UFO-like isoform X3 [Dysidea avara]
MNYIDTRVTNQYCRNYLKTALCVTIYPPCDGGVQRLCSEECDSLLNSGTCSDDTVSLIDHVNNFISDPSINFTVNCSNSLQFSSSFLNTSTCHADNCVFITNTADTPNTCVQFNNLIEVCAQHSLATNNYLYQYTSVHNLTTFGNLLSVLESFTRLITDGCFNTTASFICNGIFVPCDLTTGEAKAICTNSCYKFKEDCTLEYDSIIKGAALIEGIILQLESFCADTLVLIKDAFGANTTASGVECNCLDVQNDTQSADWCINEPITNTTATDIMTIDSTATSTNSATNTATSVSTPASSPSINEPKTKSFSVIITAASVTGGLLGLCIVVWTVGILGRKKYKTNQNTRSCGFSSIKPYALFVRKRNGSGIKDVKKVKFTKDDLKALMQGCTELSDIQLPACEVTFTESIGEGAFGLIYKGTWTHQIADNNEASQTTQVVALKTIKDYDSFEGLKSILRETVLMNQCDHPNVLSVLGVSLDTDNEGGLPFIVLPFMANGDLKAYLKSRRMNNSGVDQLPEGMEQHDLFNMCYQIACGMNYLAMKKLIHRDLAARNCMVDEDLNIKIADFGLARNVYTNDYYRQQSTGKIPIRWMAPEALHDRISNEKTDVWSYGITCWEIYSLGRSPYPTIPNQRLLEFIDGGNRPVKPQFCPDNMYSLMLRCWEANAQKRICFQEIVTEIGLEAV